MLYKEEDEKELRPRWAGPSIYWKVIQNKIIEMFNFNIIIAEYHDRLKLSIS